MERLQCLGIWRSYTVTVCKKGRAFRRDGATGWMVNVSCQNFFLLLFPSLCIVSL